MREQLELLTDDQADRIHESGLQLLEKTGMTFGDGHAIDVLKRAGFARAAHDSVFDVLVDENKIGDVE